MKLAEKQLLPLTARQRQQLEAVNASLPGRGRRKEPLEHQSGFGYWGKKYRFNFNTMDTLPYWYERVVGSFAGLDVDTFVCAAERWIVDEWNVGGDVWKAEEGREGRFEQDRALTMTSHGTLPTVERFRSHLEWHAMWCVLGEFLKKEPLAEERYYGDDLSHRISSSKLVAPPMWSADLVCPTPLEVHYWRQDEEPLESWLDRVNEDVYLASLFSQDPPLHICVNGWSRRRMRDRMETTRIHSALVTASTAQSLVRALQTMDDSWGYGVPFEGEDSEGELDEPPFQFLGWLRSADYDSSSGIDGKDPFRAFGFGVRVEPGMRVTEACGLRQQGAHPVWVANGVQEPMFVYQTWGEENEEEDDNGEFTVSGRRLLTEVEQLRRFLRESTWDLVIEVEVTRYGKRTGRWPSGGDDERHRVARIYRLGSDGHYEDAEGRVGTWPSDC